MTARRFMDTDCKPPQVLRQAYIANIMDRLLGYAHLASWEVQRYTDSVVFNSKDGKRELKLDTDLTFTLTVIHGKGDARSNRWPCKTIDDAWAMCDSTLKAYK